MASPPTAAVAEVAGTQLQALSSLRESSATFIDSLTAAQGLLRGTASQDCIQLQQSVAETVRPQVQAELQSLEDNVWTMVRNVAATVANWGREHISRVEQLSNDLMHGFKDNSTNPKDTAAPSLPQLLPGARPESLANEGARTGETEAERSQRVMGRLLREKEIELRKIAVRSLQEKATLQRQLSEAQSEVRQIHEEGTRRVAALRETITVQQERNQELERKLLECMEELQATEGLQRPTGALRGTHAQDLGPQPWGSGDERSLLSGDGSVQKRKSMKTRLGSPRRVSSPQTKPPWSSWPKGIPGEADLSAFGGKVGGSRLRPTSPHVKPRGTPAKYRRRPSESTRSFHADAPSSTRSRRKKAVTPQRKVSFGNIVGSDGSFFTLGEQPSKVQDDSDGPVGSNQLRSHVRTNVSYDTATNSNQHDDTWDEQSDSGDDDEVQWAQALEHQLQMQRPESDVTGPSIVEPKAPPEELIDADTADIIKNTAMQVARKSTREAEQEFERFLVDKDEDGFGFILSAPPVSSSTASGRLHAEMQHKVAHGYYMNRLAYERACRAPGMPREGQTASVGSSLADAAEEDEW